MNCEALPAWGWWWGVEGWELLFWFHPLPCWGVMARAQSVTLSHSDSRRGYGGPISGLLVRGSLCICVCLRACAFGFAEWECVCVCVCECHNGQPVWQAPYIIALGQELHNSVEWVMPAVQALYCTQPSHKNEGSTDFSTNTRPLITHTHTHTRKHAQTRTLALYVW